MRANVAGTPSTASSPASQPIGTWTGDPSHIVWDEAAWSDLLEQLDAPLFAVRDREGRIGLTTAGAARIGSASAAADDDLELRAYVPALTPDALGDPDFRAAHGLKYAYVAGAMANGIGSVEIVSAMSRAGMLGFFGAAGLDPARIEAALVRLAAELGDSPYGSNLIHSPHDPALERATVDLYLKHDVRRVSASAYLGLTPEVVRYRAAGLYRTRDGRVVTSNHVFAKVSRVEVARRFLSPPPEKMLTELVAARKITAEQAALAAGLPLCDELTAEADSGGHTDNRPALALVPTMIALRDEVAAECGYATPPRVGAAGGIATPASVAAAFAMGAAYVLTGSINQACVESGSCDAVRRMLADAGQADVMMAPAADMFEMGVQVQVLKRGTLFGVRARKLYELYRQYGSLEEIPAAQRATLEKDYFRATLEEAWASTAKFFETRDPAQLERAVRDPKHRMALVFRAYLGLSSRWANSGEPTRQTDYQIWCGPAMGAFNEWTRGTPLALPENRRVATIASLLLAGAAKLIRANCLRDQGLRLSAACGQVRPHA